MLLSPHPLAAASARLSAENVMDKSVADVAQCRLYGKNRFCHVPDRMRYGDYDICR